MFTLSTRSRVKGFLGTMFGSVHTRLAAQLLIRGSRGLVLTFHYIGTPVIREIAEDLFIPPPEFRAALDFVARYLTPLAPADFLKRLRGGTLPRRATMIAFDDCTNTTVVRAYPELNRRRLSACFFVNPGLIAAKRTIPCLELMSICASAPCGDYEVHLGPVIPIRIQDEASRAAAYRKLWPAVLHSPSWSHPELFRKIRACLHAAQGHFQNHRLANWDVLRELDSTGMLVGNHTMFHSTITADGVERFATDVAQAYGIIERNLGRKIRVFCYPYGRTNDAAHGGGAVLRDLQTEFAFLTQGGFADARRSGCLALRREDASYSAGAIKLAPLLACLR